MLTREYSDRLPFGPKTFHTKRAKLGSIDPNNPPTSDDPEFSNQSSKWRANYDKGRGAWMKLQAGLKKLPDSPCPTMQPTLHAETAQIPLFSSHFSTTCSNGFLSTLNICNIDYLHLRHSLEGGAQSQNFGYDNWLSKSSQAIVAENNQGTGSNSWVDVMFASWQKLTYDNHMPPSQLGVVVRLDVENSDDEQTVTDIWNASQHKEASVTPRAEYWDLNFSDGSSDSFDDGMSSDDELDSDLPSLNNNDPDPPTDYPSSVGGMPDSSNPLRQQSGFPTVSFTPSDPNFYAILGTSRGIDSATLLTKYANFFATRDSSNSDRVTRVKTIKSISVGNQDAPSIALACTDVNVPAGFVPPEPGTLPPVPIGNVAGLASVPSKI